MTGNTGILPYPPIDATGASLPPSRIAQGGASAGQVLKWNGTAWAPGTDNTGGGGGGSTFVSLDDTPASYSGSGGFFVRVNTGASALEFLSPAGVLSAIAAAPASHTHAISDVTGLQTALDGKAATSHTHAISDVTGLQAALDGKVGTARQVATQHSLQGGGDLSADRTLSLVGDTASPGNNKVYGTDAFGNRGWKDDPSGGGGSAYDPEFRNEVICPCTVVANSYVNMIARTEIVGAGAVVAGAGAADLGEALFRDSNGGAVMLSSGTTTTGRAHCVYANAPGSSTFRYFRPSAGAPWNAGFVVIGTHRPDATEDFVFRIGFQFINNVADPNDPMAQFVVARTLNNGDTWHVQARATTGGARTTVDTGVGVNRTSDASPAWNRMRLTWSASAVDWWIDGTSGQITTNIPDQMLGCGVNIVKIAGTTDRRLFWSDGRVWQPRATRKW